MVSRLTLYCDRCEAAERTAEGTPERLGVDAVWYEVHLCASCRKELLDGTFREVIRFFTEHGEELNGSGEGRHIPEGHMPCLWCPKTYTSQGGLDLHLRTVHRFANPEDAWGHRCPACGSEDFAKLSTHAARSHSRHVSVLMMDAIAAGDPYAVVKSRSKAGRR